MIWAALLRYLPHAFVADGLLALVFTGAQWWAGVREAPLRAEIVRLGAVIARHEDAARLAAQTAALAVQASRDRAETQYREDRYEINRLLAREADLLAAADDARADLARQLREQYAAGRAAARRHDRDSVPQAGRDRQPSPAPAAPAGVVPGARPADPDRFDVAADVAMTGEQAAAVARILIAAAREGRCVKLVDTP